ncbi:hypothetical protein J6590_085005 [Homalodisca vitripennis]|nr:hypothetical protein J6590_085005 [Homalodisca vitripennis]
MASSNHKVFSLIMNLTKVFGWRGQLEFNGKDIITSMVVGIRLFLALDKLATPRPLVLEFAEHQQSTSGQFHAQRSLLRASATAPEYRSYMSTIYSYKTLVSSFDSLRTTQFLTAT